VPRDPGGGAAGAAVGAEGECGDRCPERADGHQEQRGRDRREIGDQGWGHVARELCEGGTQRRRTDRRGEGDREPRAEARPRVATHHLHHEKRDDQRHREGEQVAGRGQGGEAAHPDPGDEHLEHRDGAQSGARERAGEGGESRGDGEQRGDREGGAGTGRAEQLLERGRLGRAAEQLGPWREEPARAEHGGEQAGDERAEQQRSGHGIAAGGAGGGGRCRG
jgi:hypothetical protein